MILNSFLCVTAPSLPSTDSKSGHFMQRIGAHEAQVRELHCIPKRDPEVAWLDAAELQKPLSFNGCA